MAEVYVDLDLGSGANDGSSWANAYQNPSDLAGASLSAGDNIWIQGNTNTHSSSQLDINLGSDAQNPIKFFGCKQGTTAEPPAQSDLIPGWRTGETRTLANRAYKDADVPVITVATADLFKISGHANWYGVKFSAGDELRIADSSFDSLVFEECLFVRTGFQDEIKPAFNGAAFVLTKNCGIDTNNNNDYILPQGSWEDVGLEYVGTTPSDVGLFSPNTNIKLIGMDLTALGANPVVSISSIGGVIDILNTQLNSSAVLTTGSPGDSRFLLTFGHTTNVTGKSSGTISVLDIVTESGNIAEETTAVRTGGASDGSTSYSLAFTPNANGTRDQYKGIVGPWMAFKVTGDGTSQTVSVFIANSGAADYNDDDVWLEVMYPSEGGTAQYDNVTTQMDLLDTPAAVTDDTDSTWGSGGNNPQKLEASIAPDYVGRAYCRAVFAKNFSSSPETLYVDPLPVVS